MKKKIGRIEIEPGATPLPHESLVAEVLAERGNDILFLKPIDQDKIKTPDIEMGGARWEIKTPKGKGKFLLQNTFHKALHQSVNIIIDIRRIKIPEQKALKQLENLFEKSRSVKKMIIITKQKKMLDFTK